MDTRTNLIGSISAFSKNNFCFFIAQPTRIHYIYKYIDINTAMLCLKNNNIRFSQPHTWKDQYESRFYKADYSKITKTENTPIVHACCVTLNKACEASWNTYSYNKTGIGAHCVQFKINKVRFRKQLEKYARKHNCRIYEGVTTYNLSDYEIDNLHLKKSPYYNEYFIKFDKTKFLNLLLIKRAAFKYEEEYRFFVIHESNNVKNDFIDIEINWRDIIEEIKIDGKCSSVEIESFRLFCKNYNIDVDITPWDIHKNPVENITIE